MIKGFFARAFGYNLFHWLFGDNRWIILLIFAVLIIIFIMIDNGNTKSVKEDDTLAKRFRSLVYTIYGASSASYVTEHIISKGKKMKYGGLSRSYRDDYTLFIINNYWYKRMKDGTPVTEKSLTTLNFELSMLYDGKTKDIPKLVLKDYVCIEFRIYDDEYLGDILDKYKSCVAFADTHFDKWEA